MKKSWEESYEIAKEYYEKNNNLTIKTSEIYNDYDLGGWISKQRVKYNKKSLSKEKIKKLEEIGIIWNQSEKLWNDYYKILVKYYKINGNIDFPNSLTFENLQLGRWIAKQREKYIQKELSQEKIQLLNNLKIKWYNPKSAENIRQKYIKACIEYKREYKNLNVPYYYKDDAGLELGKWISKQRKAYQEETINNRVYDILTNLEFDWKNPNTGDIKWRKMYELAMKYYNINNNIDLGYNEFFEGENLGHWIVTQRKNYQNSKLSKKRIELLERINIKWNNPQNANNHWEKMYIILKKFYDRYKHLYIPLSYVTKDGVKLGRWLYLQRNRWIKGMMSKEKEEKLNKLDVTWKEKIYSGTSFPEQAILYYIQKKFPTATKYKTDNISEIDIFIPELKIGIEYDGGRTHKNVERDIKKTIACNNENIKLIRVREPKCKEINDDSFHINLKDLSNASLESAIMDIFNYLKVETPIISIADDYQEIVDMFIKGIDLQWYSMYEKLKEYYNRFGNSRVPVNYITEDGTKLGVWVNTQREGRKNSSIKTLSTQKIKLLDKLDFVWSPYNDEWNNMYQLAQKYFEENGNLLININYEVGNQKLGKWISIQRRNKKISDERKRKLNNIGMIWSPYELTWEEYYVLAKEYYRKNKNLLIPIDYIVKDKKLGLWINTQRRRKRENKLTEERINKLEKINMVWKTR